MKIRLSFSTINALTNSPHTYLNKLMGLPTFSIQAFEDGKRCHKIIQDHASGVKVNPLLADLPPFPLVERVDFDENMRVEFDINNKYSMIGYVDMLNPDTKEFGEIKTGKQWSVADFARSPQLKIYALGLRDYKKMWLVNTPKDETLWMPQTIKIYNKEITELDKTQAMDFIMRGITIIEDIKNAVALEMKNKKEKGYMGRSRFCFYTGCEWCEPQGL